MTQSPMDADRPTGHLDPPSQNLSDIQSSIDDDEFEQAIDAIEEHEPKSTLHADWARYLKGLAFFGLEYFEAGYNAFEVPYERTTQILPEREVSVRMRLAAMCLKKMGWLHRRNEKFQRAYALHSIQYQYLKHYGSYEELHDATISLDVDAYFLKNAYLSQMWLQTSIEVGEEIADPVTRHRCLGMSWNNLAGTLCQLEDFEGAKNAIDNSLDHWSSFEDEAGTDEHREVWARYGVGDVYHRWGQHLLEREGEEAEEKLEKAASALDEALELADRQQMPEREREPVMSKLHHVQSALGDEQS